MTMVRNLRLIPVKRQVSRSRNAGRVPMQMFRKIMCWLGKCTRCRTYSTYEGIGGKCIDCGKIHGWVTREELRAYADRQLNI